MVRVMFVCLGNICRSPMAEFILKDMVAKMGVEDLFQIDSAALSNEEAGNPMHHGARWKLQQMDIPFSARAAVQLERADYEKYDYLIAMEERQLAAMQRICGQDTEGKMCTLLQFTAEPRDIADPWYTGDFDQAYDDIVMGCRAFLETVLQK